MTDNLPLTIVDYHGHNAIEMCVNKSILFAYCPKFEKMYYEIKGKNEIGLTIKVGYPAIAHDLIMSFYNWRTNSGKFPRWFHQLETIILSKRWGLKIDHLCIDKVPKNNYQLLTRAIPILGLCKPLVSALIKSRPENVSLETMQKILGDKLVEKSGLIVGVKRLDISSDGSDLVCEFYVTNGSKYIYRQRIDPNYLNVISSPTNFLFGIIYDKFILVINFKMLTFKYIDLVNPIDYKNESDQIIFSPDGQYLAVCYDHHLTIYSVKTGLIIYERKVPIFDREIGAKCMISFSPDSKLIALAFGVTFLVIDFIGKRCLLNMGFDSVYDLCSPIIFSPCCQKICLYGKNNYNSHIEVFDLVEKISVGTNDIGGNHIDFMSDSAQVVIAKHNQIWVWSINDDITTMIYEFDYEIKNLLCLPCGIICVTTNITNTITHLDENGNIIHVPQFATNETDHCFNHSEYRPIKYCYCSITGDYLF